MTYCPWADLGRRYPEVRVVVADIWPARAAWIASAGVLFVDRRLNRADGRSAVAHELAHMDLEHVSTEIAHWDDIQERDADKLAARRLISVADLADAYAWTHDDDELAETLHVDTHMVHVRLGSLHPAERSYIEARIARVENVA